MKLKNILIVVNDIEVSKRFYKSLFGLDVVTDFGGNVILTEGLVLQERKIWEEFIHDTVTYKGKDTELYFEENDMDGFAEKLKNSDFQISYVNENMVHDWGQRVIRIYDPDGHIIEIGEALEYVAKRFLKDGMNVEQVAAKTQLPVAQVMEIENSMFIKTDEEEEALHRISYRRIKND